MIVMVKKLWLLGAPLLMAQPSFEGNWVGRLDAGPAKLQLVFRIVKIETGYKSTFDSPDQGVTGVPVDTTSIDGNKLHFEVSKIRASYDGTISVDGKTIDGKFTQGATIPLVLNRVDKIEAKPRPQTPKPPFPYATEELTIQGRGATLTKPNGAGPFPAVVLITGSGTHDRDETLFQHKPFLVIADYLTRQGVAALRVDDRPTKAQSTFDDLAGDVVAEVDLLASRKDIDAKKIGVIGHSEGASVGPLAALRSDRIAFVVMLAGMGVKGEDALLKQGELVVRSAGFGDVAVKTQRTTQETLFAIIREEKDPQVAAEKLKAAIKKLAPMAPAATIDAQVNQVNNMEMRSILGFDGPSVLKRLTVPVLALNGSRDIQVSSEQNIPAIAAVLKNPDSKAIEMPGLNHLFQKCTKCTVQEYSDLEETFSPDALKIMGDWIRKR
jgi:pimeloyl-ACP methyl ester carboxylesterase